MGLLADTPGNGEGGQAVHVAGEVAEHPVVDAGARAGYAVNGFLHLLIAWLGLQVAFGNKGAAADPSGALAVVTGTAVGWIVLVAVIAAFVLLALWQVTEAVRGRRLGDRVKSVAKAVTYLALASGAFAYLRGAGTSGAKQATDATSALMTWPFGPMLVVAVGFGVGGIGVYHIHKGWTEKFRRDLASRPGALTVNAGRLGYIAKGVSLIAVGASLVTAGLRHRPSESQGLDGALHAMVSLPLGQLLVTVVAAGFAAFGFYSFSRARRAKT